METWREVWRRGFAPILPRAGLEALAEALRTDDPRLTQGSTTTPPPLMCVQDYPCEAADAIGFAGAATLGGLVPYRRWQSGPWKDSPYATVGQVEEFFADACFRADCRFGEPAACRWFLNWFDNTPRDEMRYELLAEVELALRTHHTPSEAEPCPTK